MDPWAVLGVAPGSSERAVRAAYLRRSKELHPDLGGTDAAMRELNAAYDTLRSANWPAQEPESVSTAGQFVYEPPPATRPSAPVYALRVKKPKKPIYKRVWVYVVLVVFVAFLASSGATNEPSPKNRPAIFGLIGRCVDLVNNEISAVVPCAGPHDAWVVDVIDRPGTCGPLAERQVGTVSHIVCLDTDR